MQTMTFRNQHSAYDGMAASVSIPRNDVTTLARLLKDAGRTLSIDPIAASNILARADGLLAFMLRETDSPTKVDAGEGGMSPWQIRRVRSHVEEHLHEPLPVSQLSSSVSLSSSYFSRAFKLSFGCSPHTYILRRRIERAKDLIRGSDEPLVQVALECGLSDQAHLSRVFRLQVGWTPSGWRRNIRQ